MRDRNYWTCLMVSFTFCATLSGKGYGEDFEINQPTQEITIKLKRPQGQYSIYDDKPKQEEKKPAEKPK